jgi:diguanylate cyclase (GGDEF)-like protein
LHASNIRVEQALALVEQKAAELEIANAKLQELSVRDPLTGLFNRRRFDQALTSEWARAGHGGKPLALLVLDLDYFKQYNDRYGHQAGDACLQQVGSILQNHARRAGDVAARFGGEEFCLICPYTNKEQAESIAQSLRQSILDQALPHEDSPFGLVTVSIGYMVATPDATCTSDHLLHLADQALYLAKDKGRNCIQFIETLPTIV